MAVLQQVGVHQQGLAGAGSALEGDRAQLLRPVLRQGGGEAVALPVAVEVGAQRRRVLEVAAQVMFGEQQSGVLMRLPGAAMLTGHPQLLAVERDVGGVLGQQTRCYARLAGQVHGQYRGIITRPAGGIDRRAAQPPEHAVQVVKPELPADEPVQHQPVPQQLPAARSGERHYGWSSLNISSRKIGSMNSAVQASSGGSRAFRVWSPLT